MKTKGSVRNWLFAAACILLVGTVGQAGAAGQDSIAFNPSVVLEGDRVWLGNYGGESLSWIAKTQGDKSSFRLQLYSEDTVSVSKIHTESDAGKCPEDLTFRTTDMYTEYLPAFVSSAFSAEEQTILSPNGLSANEGAASMPYWIGQDPEKQADGDGEAWYGRIVDETGTEGWKKLDETAGLRPAVSVVPVLYNPYIMSLEAEKEFDSASLGLKKVPVTGTGQTDWKLSITDRTRKFRASSDEESLVAMEGYTDWTIDFTYRYAETGAGESIIGMLYKDGEVSTLNELLFYGVLARDLSEKSAKGRISVTIPAGLTEGEYRLCLYNEKRNAGKESNIISPPYSAVSLTVTKEAGKLEVTQEGAVFVDWTSTKILPSPSYTKPEEGGKESLSYSGTLRNGNKYGPTSMAPWQAGSYTVQVSYLGGKGLYTGDADFTIAPRDISGAVIETAGPAVCQEDFYYSLGIDAIKLDGEDITNYCILSGNQPPKPGKYTVTATAKENSNYTGSVSAEYEAVKGVLDIGTVTAAVVKDTLDPAAVVLSRSDENIGIGGTLALDSSVKTLALGTASYDWIFTPDEEASIHYEIARGTVDITVVHETHSWDEGTVTQEATCGAEGVKTYTCSICGETSTEAIPKIAAHSWDTGKVTREATQEEEGIITFTCVICGTTRTEALEKLPPESSSAEEESSQVPEESSPSESESAQTPEESSPSESESAQTPEESSPSESESAQTPEESSLPESESAETPSESTPAESESEKAQVEAEKILFMAKAVSRSATKEEISWNRIPGASRYVISMNLCNTAKKKYTLKTVKTVTGKSKVSCVIKGLKKGESYKFQVEAQKKVNGKYQTLQTSEKGHFIAGGQNKKYSDPKSLKLKKTGISLKKGKTYTISASLKLINSKKKMLDHVAELRFRSSNSKIASVNKNGKVTAKKKGTCTIYVIAVNGLWKTMKVTVK